MVYGLKKPQDLPQRAREATNLQRTLIIVYSLWIRKGSEDRTKEKDFPIDVTRPVVKRKN
jgi:hypothetical protein